MTRFPSETSPQNVKYVPATVAFRDLQRLTGLTFSRASFYRWLMDGTIPSRRIVTRIFVAVEDLQAFAQETFQP